MRSPFWVLSMKEMSSFCVLGPPFCKRKKKAVRRLLSQKEGKQQVELSKEQVGREEGARATFEVGRFDKSNKVNS